jgi:hypothetical protein
MQQLFSSARWQYDWKLNLPSMLNLPSVFDLGSHQLDLLQHLLPPWRRLLPSLTMRQETEHRCNPCPQANTRIAAGPTKQSLLRQWITKVIAGYSSKVTWPLQSLKLDDQLAFAKVKAGAWCSFQTPRCRCTSMWWNKAPTLTVNRRPCGPCHGASWQLCTLHPSMSMFHMFKLSSGRSPYLLSLFCHCRSASHGTPAPRTTPSRSTTCRGTSQR